MSSLLTAREAVLFSPSSNHSYIQERCPHIPFVEEELFNDCFGWAFYEALRADIAAYNYVKYGETTEYAAGVFVEHAGCIYEVIQATGEGGKPIGDTAYFEKAPKFSTPANEVLWSRYLGGIIAFRVMQGGLMYRSVKDTPKGVVKSFDPESSRPATNAEVRGVKEELGADIERMIKAMEKFIARNSSDYPLYKSGFSDCEGGAGNCRTYNPRRKLGFNV